MSESSPDFVAELLRLMARHEAQNFLFWSRDLEFSAVCSDVFAWGTADCESVTAETLPDLEKAFADAVAADPEFGALHAADLYAARRRGMRPQGAAYPKNQALWPLFDACGPEREVGTGNPYRPGEHKGTVT